MVTFFYSHHTVQSVSTSEWYVKLSIASWRNLKFATWRIAKFEHMHGLQKCTLPIFIQAVRLLQTGWFQNQPTGSSMQTGPDRSCRASSLPWVEVQWASLHNFVVVLLKIDNQEEQFSRLSPDQKKMEEKKRSIELFLCFPVTFLFHIWMLRSSGRLCGSSDDTSVHLLVHWVTKGIVIKQQWWHFQSVHTHICSGSIQILTHKMEMLTYHFPASVLNRCVQKDLVHILNVVPCVLFICVLLNSRGNDAPCASL